MIEQRITTLEQLQQILQNIKFANSVLDFKWEFHAEYFTQQHNYGWFVWVSFERPDCNTGEIGVGFGRKEIVWSQSTESSVVKTCWLLIELMVRHELMEGFTYKGKRIFNPHNTIQQLMSIQ
jgi:hypothetical protein